MALLAKMPEELTQELRKAVGAGNAEMKSNLKPRIREFTGSTARSISSKIKVNGPGSITGITGPSDSGKNPRAHILRLLQDGSYYQNKQNTQPWVHELRNWVVAKFNPPEKDILRTSYALARSLKQKGTKGTPIVRPLMKEKQGFVTGLISSTLKIIVEKMRVK